MVMFYSRHCAEMTAPRLIVVLITSPLFVYAFVDTYVPHYPETKTVKDNLAAYAYSSELSDRRDQILARYTGDAADACKTELKKKSWYNFVVTAIKSTMIQAVSKAESLDKKWYDAVQNCSGDQACIDITNEDSRNKLQDLQSSVESQLQQIKEEHFENVKNYMDTCTTQS